MLPKVYTLTLNKVEQDLQALGNAPDTAGIVLNLIYRSRHKSFEQYSQLSQKARDHFKTNYEHELPTIVRRQNSTDGTVKLLLGLEDGESVESVLLPFYKKYTLCVSSQVGCAMNCKFCFTATQGFKRNLRPHEIIGQVLKAKEVLKEMGEKRDIANIVFMGQGEPLHNFEALKEAISILTEPKGLGLGKRSITVSTSGYLPGLKRFEELGGVNLALSLHSTNDEVRSKLIPINNRYPLNDVLAQIDRLERHERQTVEYEYLLIDDLNDSKEDAKDLARVLNTRTHMINIIPFNPFPGSEFKRPMPERVEEFKQWLVEEDARVMVRKTKGDDILAACGQLKS
tara:strand:+ start:2098 stop:3123 length:1026 start_codon:yes stop_codon:yes gene_type:complete